MLYIKLECQHFLIKNPKELNYEVPDTEKQIHCPTCKEDQHIEYMASMRKEVLRHLIDSSEVSALKKEQPHLARQQCLYILQRRPSR